MAIGIAEDLTNQKINHWTVLQELGGGYVTAQCDCGVIKKIRKSQIKNGHSKSCGCLSGKQKRDIVGQKINHWTIIEEVGEGKVLCQCDCAAGTVKELYKKAVYEGKSKSCGCASGRQKRDIVGQKINHWSVLEDLGHGKVRCQCDCEAKTVRILYKKAVYEGKTKSCGCAKGYYNNIAKQDGYYARINNEALDKYKQMDFGEWEVLKFIQGKNKLLCKCSCGTIKEVYASHLVNGMSRSCGCKQTAHTSETIKKRYNEISTKHVNKPREQWQIEAISSKESLLNYIDTYKKENNDTADIEGIRQKLGISPVHMLRKIHEFKLEDRISMPKDSISHIENLLYNYIRKSTDKEVIRNSRKIIPPLEVDIYIPDSKIGIEVNGDYWHSTLYKDKEYHKEKTFMTSNNGVRLITIYEHEMRNTPEKIKSIIDSALGFNIQRIYARKCVVKEIDTKESMEFEDKYHLDNRSSASIRVGIYYDEQLIGEISFGKPRFDSKYDYELIRLCYKSNISVIGGTEKMFKYAVEKFKLDNIVTYCNMDKFSGQSFLRLGFGVLGVTEPGYIWVKHGTHEVLRRYQTQKHKLLENGLGTPEQTEDEIMMNLNFFKIYNSGNLKLAYNKERK